MNYVSVDINGIVYHVEPRTIRQLVAEVEALKDSESHQMVKLKESLAFYGDIMNYGPRDNYGNYKHLIDIDRGKRARAALEGKDEARSEVDQ
jgi:hypothetical protein